MDTLVQSTIVGTLTRDASFYDWWLAKPFSIPFFGGIELPIIFTTYVPEDDATFIQDADIALGNFLTLNTENKVALSNLILDYASSKAPLEVNKILDAETIWSHLEPTEIYVSRRQQRDTCIYIQISCECDWDKENGLLLVFKEGKKLTRISGVDSYLTNADAFDIPDADDTLLASF